MIACICGGLEIGIIAGLAALVAKLLHKLCALARYGGHDD